MNLFVYGTLRYRPLLEVVLGREVTAAEPACLKDHAVYWADGQSFPLLVAEPGGEVEGLLLLDLSETDLERLNYYEGGFAYALHPVTVTLGSGGGHQGQVYFPTPGVWSTGSPWSLEDWVSRWGEMTLYAAREAMAHFGHWSAEALAQRFGIIRARAWARLAAQRRPGSGRALPHVAKQRRPYTNFFAVEEYDLQVPRFDGTMGPVINRAAFFVGEAAVVLPYDPVLDTVLLTEQFRVPPFATGDPDPWLLEPVSGLIDPGETPQEAAHREALEEAGLRLDRLEPVSAAYSSTGSSTEFVHMFVGLADLSETAGKGGLASEGEDIRTHVVPFETLMTDIDSGRHRDMPLLVVALWLARNRDRLRENA
ncbi:gamma-glutamylcyclotransferase [Thalassococcus sp. S3]|uniref:gamma-glutamylcyclotransferase n=1 Tax=Thalassococcus sp. S3 TaxID=2017482 RepID=UPI0020C37276|nr:gamma-glutamylcyclotransferase [Thalassococcus sp. S3]